MILLGFNVFSRNEPGVSDRGIASTLSMVVVLEVAEVSGNSSSRELELDPTMGGIELSAYTVSDMVLWSKSL